MGVTITILGCGSSGGVPRPAAGWGACDPNEPRNRRRRCSILIDQAAEGGDAVGQGPALTRILVDTSPDLREQLLDAEVRALDAVIFTHEHADHTHGIDDLRPLVIVNRRRIPVHLDAPTRTALRPRFGYCFETPAGSAYPPLLDEQAPIQPGQPFTVTGAGGAVPVTPFRLVHGDIDSLGLRVGGAAYTPDVSAIPEESLAFLENLDLWIIDALRPAPHPSHLSLSEALAWIERLRPRRAVLTNLHVDLDYQSLRAALPPHVEPAYDGMRLNARDA